VGGDVDGRDPRVRGDSGASGAVERVRSKLGWLGCGDEHDIVGVHVVCAVVRVVTSYLLAADYVNDLIATFSTSEKAPGWKHPYVKRHPALLDQLENTLTGSTTGGETIRTPAGSRPAGRIDVLAFLERIQAESAELATGYGIPLLPLRARLSRLAGAMGLDDPAPVRAWWVTARVLTSFDSPAFAPNVPCPNEECERRGSLRVRLEEDVTRCMAVCVECHRTWDGEYFGVFAAWIRWSYDHLVGDHLCSECVTVHAAMQGRVEARRKESLGGRAKSRYASSRR
jgi:hypothetical protein